MTIETYQIFNEAPDWSSGVTMTYAFQTSLFSSQRYQEQRKAVDDLPRLSQGLSIFTENSPSAYNRLKACFQKIMYVPIFVEALRPVAFGTGLETILLSEETAYFFNLARAAKVIAFEQGSPLTTATLLDLVSVGADSITIAPNAYVFTSCTRIFPVMLALLDSFSKVCESTTQDTYVLTFNEFMPETGDE